MVFSNRKAGNSFELEFCEALADNGFWCHNLKQNSAGQPADVIAVKNGKGYLIDCKLCSSDKFALSRIEDNQIYAMHKWSECGNETGWFAIKIRNEIYMIGLETLEKYDVFSDKTYLSYEEIKRYFGITFKRWC